MSLPLEAQVTVMRARERALRDFRERQMLSVLKRGEMEKVKKQGSPEDADGLASRLATDGAAKGEPLTETREPDLIEHADRHPVYWRARRPMYPPYVAFLPPYFTTT